MRGTECHLSEHELKYLKLLAVEYPTIQAVCTEIINLQAILNLPKGTEHFMSDLHGEYDAFYHIVNNCSGVIREKVDLVFGKTLNEQERSKICTLIYYPEQKLRYIKQSEENMDAWYQKTLHQLIGVCRITASKYTRSKVRKALPPEFSYIIDELLHAQPGEDSNQQVYHAKIIDTIIGINNADEFITALCSLIKRLAVDHLHIVGDIFDRGPGADRIMDLLMQHHAVDVEWGNHDILWMGAASGSEACAAAVVRNTVAGGNLATLESGYGISMRELAMFAKEQYPECDDLNHAIRKAISIILFKLEGQLILRHPEFQMEHRMLLHKINYEAGTVEIEGKTYTLNTTQFPTIHKESPYELTEEEKSIMHGLMEDFKESDRLHRHMRFLYAKGGMYKCFNQNLLFHGCIPMTNDGELTNVNVGGRIVKGRELMDLSDKIVRRAYFAPHTAADKPFCLDYMWYLWSGKDSPLFGREKMTTFERMFIDDKSSWTEQKNPYYKWYNEEESCVMLLKEFGLNTPFCHIINGHVPVRAGDGESPIKGNGKLIVIDGGFCEAYHPTTGIAGYTLIYNSHGMRIKSHQPFDGVRSALEENKDIQSRSDIFETHFARMMVMDTDNGNDISNQIYDLTLLLNAYRQGFLAPKVTK
ncbi:MAG: fructose-1,6-bisphosphatase [Clostridium sp.]|uniref:fructose-1,6-bisphosphatase n=1 Tax=Clostridium sp. TaxID=1506 RepID=UPI002906C8ED|nr:fructose-1,6-bisphosphatase [Clostridium sp.]MDU7336519.1 fructose-1,6-bisphosphatase [Clostridium sp.]